VKTPIVAEAIFALAFSLSLPAFGSGQQQPPQPPTLTDAKIVQMVQSKMSADLIILEVSKCTPNFALDPASLQYMTQNGVSDDIIKAMAARQNGQPIPGQEQPLQQPQQQPPASQTVGKPRVFMASASKGNTWNARRNQSMELGRDFEKVCPDVQITVNQQAADYVVELNHIEVGPFARNNQVQVSDRNGDVLNTREAGSIKNGAKKACALIVNNWASKHP
jgi:hypothetical protein